MDTGVVIQPRYIRDFILAGNSEFVLANTKTGNHIAYKVRATRNVKSQFALYFVYVKTDSSVYAGHLSINCQGGSPRYIKGDKGAFDSDSQCIKVLLWFLTTPAHLVPSNMCCLHVGKCGRCGRKLTDPESIAVGLGPDCRTKVRVGE